MWDGRNSRSPLYSKKNVPNPLGTGSKARPLSENRYQGKHARAFAARAANAKGRRMALPTPLVATLYVALGGAAGSALRYQAGRGVTHWLGATAGTAFPWATLAVNLLGSLAMGLLAGWLARAGDGGEHWRLLLGVGLLGGFTTFSAFSLELMLLIERGQPGLAFAYALLSVVAGLAALWLGLVAMRFA
jgi:CrcB protein